MRKEAIDIYNHIDKKELRESYLGPYSTVRDLDMDMPGNDRKMKEMCIYGRTQADGVHGECLHPDGPRGNVH